MKRKKDTAPSPERLEILEKIRRLEAEGGESYHVDVEPDPSGHQLRPDEVASKSTTSFFQCLSHIHSIHLFFLKRPELVDQEIDRQADNDIDDRRHKLRNMQHIDPQSK